MSDIIFCLRANEIVIGTFSSFNKLKPKSQNVVNPKTAVQAIWNDLSDETIQRGQFDPNFR